MGNAEPLVQGIANCHITATNDQDDVALAIERFVLHRDGRGHNPPGGD